MIITRTPYRVSFFGGGTDYNSWYREKTGLVVTAAIDKYCYISLRPLPPYFDHKTRAVYSKVESVTNNEDIQHPAIMHCLKYMNMTDGLEIHHDGDLPARSGIGSSSSFTVGFLNAIHALRYQMVTRDQLAREAIEVEQVQIKEAVGIQDQIIAAHGGFQAIKMGPGDHYEASPIILPPDYMREFERNVMLGFTGIHRTAAEYAEEQIQNIQSGSSSKPLNEILAIAEEGLSLFRNQSSFASIGALLDKSWQMKRKLGSNVTNPFIDQAYEAAIKAGAYGGKLLGAGGGGFMMFMAPPERQAAIRAELKKINVWVPFKIAPVGSQVVFHSSN